MVTDGLSMMKVEGIGCVRYCLSVVADCMNQVVQQQQGIPDSMKHLFKQAKHVCERWQLDGARSVKLTNTIAL